MIRLLTVILCDLMATAKIAITLDDSLLREVDRWVAQKLYPNRSQAIQAALFAQATQVNQQRLEAECAKLDPQEEQEFAELGIEEAFLLICQRGLG
jgi:Arc/MetJ-type ribon-helix-helix transcriptional regulator